MQIKILSLICLIWLLSLNLLYGDENAGTTSTALLEFSTSVRGDSTGGAFTSVLGGIDSITFNPAGLASVQHIEGAISYSPYLDDTSIYTFSGAFNVNKIGAFAVSLMNLSYGDIMQTMADVNGNVTATGSSVSASELAIIGTYSRVILADELYGGINIKYSSIKLAGVNGNSMAFDIGGIYKNEADDWEIGFSVANMGSGVKVVEQAYSLPLTLRIGGNYEFKISDIHSILGLLDIDNIKGEGTQIIPGVEYDFRDIIYVRAGYKINSDTKGFKAGLGIRYKIVKLDYGLELYSGWGIVNRVQLGVEF